LVTISQANKRGAFLTEIPSRSNTLQGVIIMGRSRPPSKTFVLLFSLLIVLSGLSAVNPTFQVVGAEPTRSEEKTLYVDDDAPDGGDRSQEKPYQKIQDEVR